MARQAIWKSIARTTPRQLIAGYSKLIQDGNDYGFDAYFLKLYVQAGCWTAERAVSEPNE